MASLDPNKRNPALFGQNNLRAQSFSSGGGGTNKATSTTNTSNTSTTTGNSTQRDTGTITDKTLVPEWARQGLQDQYGQANANNQQAGDFYSSILGGTNASADLWANRQMKQMMQQMTGAPGFTETGAAAQGIAGAEAAAAVQAMMMDRMFQASQGIQGVGQNTVPFLNMAGDWADKQQVRDLTSTNNSTQTTNSTGTSSTTNKSPSGGTRSTVQQMLGGGGGTGGYQGPMYGNQPGLPGAGAGLHPLYAAFLQQNNPSMLTSLANKGVY